MAWCVMVKGPCRGKLCDYWARVKIRKKTIEEIAEMINKSIKPILTGGGLAYSDAIRKFWSDFGVKDMGRLCNEEPDLCEKIRKAENLAKGN